MKTIILLSLLLAGNFCYGDSKSNDFGKHSGEVENLTNQKLRKQLAIEGNVYVLDGSGDRLMFEGPEERTWRFASTGDLISHWSFSADRIEQIALKHTWVIDKKGRINVHIQQYDKMVADKNGKAPKLGKLIKEKRIVISNFEPITWKVRSNKKETVVARFTPRLMRANESQQVGKIPVSGKNIIMADNKGFVWTPDATFSGEYISLKTIRGTVYLSYQQFKGSKEIGYANENKMRIDVGEKHHLNLISTAPFLPFGLQAKVYGKVNLKSKSRPGSTHIQSSSEEKDFLPVVN